MKHIFRTPVFLFIVISSLVDSLLNKEVEFIQTVEKLYTHKEIKIGNVSKHKLQKYKSYCINGDFKKMSHFCDQIIGNTEKPKYRQKFKSSKFLKEKLDVNYDLGLCSLEVIKYPREAK